MNNYLPQVRVEQIRLAYSQLPILTVTNIVGSTALIALMWGIVPATILYAWIIAVFLTVVVATLILLFLYRGETLTEQNAAKWNSRIVTLGFFRAAAWGSSGFLFYVPNDHLQQLMIFSFMLVGSFFVTMQMAAHKPGFYAANVSIVLPATARHVIEVGPLHTTLSFLGVLYLVALVYFYQKIHRTLQDSLLLRFEKSDMAQKLETQKTELEYQKQQAEKANLAKSQFLAAASHDLRQPLHAQGLFVGELQERVHDMECQQILTNLKTSMEAMHGLFNSLLDISRLEAQVVEPKLEDFSIKILLHELYLDFSGRARDKGLILRVANSNAVIHSDPTLLQRILRNLASNAVRYTPQGKILIGCRRRGKYLQIQVWDTGIGIPKTDQKLIFQEFRQLHNPERNRQKGLGLGLATVDRLAKLLNYTVEVTSTVNKGSVFSVTVPYVSTCKAKVAAPSMTIDKNSDLAGCLIVVIDDDQDILISMRGLLMQWGCQVLTAESAAEAIAQIHNSTKKPAAIIADYRLHDRETGIEAIKKITARFNKKIPGFLITGDTAPDRLQEAQVSGYQILHKPLPPAKLRALLSYVVQSKK